MEMESWENWYRFPWEDHIDSLEHMASYLQDCQLIVDVGFGRGDVLGALKAFYLEDYSEKVFVGMERYPESARDLKDYDIHGVCASAEYLPFRKESIYGIVSTFVLDYIDRQKAIDQIKKSLKINGKSILYFHHPESNVLNDFRESLEISPDNGWMKFYISALADNMFKNYTEFNNFLMNSYMLPELHGTLNSRYEDDKSQSLCYCAYLRNTD